MLSNILVPQTLRLASCHPNNLRSLIEMHLTKYNASLSQNKVNLDTALKQTWIQHWTKRGKKLNSGQKRNDSHK